MEEKIFEGAGSRIKTLAKVLFIVGIVASIVLAIVFGWERRTYVSSYYPFTSTKSAEFEAVRFFAIIIGGPIITYINTLLIYGFGELIEKTSGMKKNVDEIEKNGKGIKTELDSVEKEIKSIPDTLKALQEDKTT